MSEVLIWYLSLHLCWGLLKSLSWHGDLTVAQNCGFLFFNVETVAHSYSHAIYFLMARWRVWWELTRFLVRWPSIMWFLPLFVWVIVLLDLLQEEHRALCVVLWAFTSLSVKKYQDTSGSFRVCWIMYWVHLNEIAFVREFCWIFCWWFISFSVNPN